MNKDSQNKGVKDQNITDKPFVRYDDYWLQKGRDMIDGSIETLSKRLTHLDNFLTYLAAGTFLGGISLTTYLESTNIGVYGFVAIPYIFIGIAKFFTNIGGTAPTLETTDMRSPTQINENYAQILVSLSKQVKKASSWVAVATGFTLVLFPLAVYFHNIDKEVEIPKTYLSIQNDASNLSLNGVLPNAEKVSLTLYGKDVKKRLKMPIYTDLLLQKPGELNATINLKEINLVLDSLDINYSANGQKLRHTFRFLPAQASYKKKKDKPVEVDSTKI